MGRPKGSKNKIGNDVREAYRLLVESVGSEKLIDWLNEIDDPAKRLDVLARLSEFVIPKLGRTELTGKDGGAVGVTLEQLVPKRKPPEGER